MDAIQRAAKAMAKQLENIDKDFEQAGMASAPVALAQQKPPQPPPRADGSGEGVSVALASSIVKLQNEMEASRRQAAAVAARQDDMAKQLTSLINISTTIQRSLEDSILAKENSRFQVLP